MTALIALLGGVRGTAFAALALAALAWGGIQSARLDSWQDRAAAAALRADAAEVRIDGFRALLVSVNAEADRQIAEAKARTLAGAQAAAEAEAEAAKLQERLTDAQERLQAAKADPTCAEQLEVTLCASIPLL